MKTIGSLAYLAKCERDCRREYQREWHHAPLDVEGLYAQVFTTGKPNVNFNITLKGDTYPSIKFEEQSRLGTFIVGVASEDGGSIVQNREILFRLDDPLSKLVEAFPDSERMKRFVEYLTNSR